MRIPVFLSPPPEQGLTAYLLEADGAAPEGSYAVRFTLNAAGHGTGCACCAPRGPAAAALSALFSARATGAAPYFNRVVARASPAGITAVRNALVEDVVAAARFRHAP